MNIKYTPNISESEIFNEISKLNYNDFIKYSKKEKKFIYPRYENWKKVQYLEPFKGLNNKKKGFSLFHFFRKQNSNEIPFHQENNTHFFWQPLARYNRFFHDFQSEFYKSSENETDETKKNLKRRILRGYEEEAIASSLLEGANTTRAKAKKMIKEGTEAITEGEKMVINNFRTILWIEKEVKNEEMSKELLCKIQKKLTIGTLKEENQSGRFRTDEDDIQVKAPDETVVHTPLNEKKLNKEMDLFIQFSNDDKEIDDKYFFHPIFKAIILHFMIGYYHPFCDGNGRTARAIFYWYLLKHGFVNIGFLPISTEIQKKRALYDNSFIYAEQERGNITYTVDMMVEILKNAKISFNKYIEDETIKINEERLLKERNLSNNLNDRQISIITYFKKYPEDETYFTRHKQIQSISLITARKDLKELESKGFLYSKKRANKIIFRPTEKLFEI